MAAPVALDPAALDKPTVKFGLRPKAAGAPPPPNAPTAEPAPAPAPLDAPVPEATPARAEADAEPPVLDIPVETGPKTRSQPDEIPMAPGQSFPPPPGKFRAPPGMAKNTEAAKNAANARKLAGGSESNKLLLIGGVVAAVLVLGGVFFVYRKFTGVPSPPPPKLVAKPAKPPAPPAEAKPKEPVATAVAVPPEVEPVVVKPAEPVVPVVAPPPAPTVAFKAWVENLRVSGVRAGSNPRVFIGGTAYAPGDLVNPQLGITFVGYNAEIRMLTFKDATGAKVDRRN
jgi:hypothetical protein